MRNNPEYSSSIWQSSNFKIKYDKNGDRILYSSDIKLVVKSTKDSLGRIEILKSAEGKDYKDAKERAKNILYTTQVNNNELFLDAYFTSDDKYKYRDQEVKVTLFLPEGTTLFAAENTATFHRGNYMGNILNRGDAEKFLKISEDAATCEGCPEETWNDKTEDEWNEDDDFNARINAGDEEVNIQINSRGLKIYKEEGKGKKRDTIKDKN
jgi:hypothetical protein